MNIGHYCVYNYFENKIWLFVFEHLWRLEIMIVIIECMLYKL